MSFTALTRLSLSIGTIGIVLAAASPARAQACKDTTQCPQGFVCEISQTPPPTDPGAPDGKTAAGLPAPADLIAPANGGYCQPAPCTKDSECGAGMLCHSETRKECSGVTPAIACAPNSDCAKPEPSPQTCTETKVSLCVYKWQLPCNTDVECGAGFNCMPVVSGSCSGSSGSGTPSSTGATAPASGAMDLRAPVPAVDGGTTCTTTTSFPGYCQPKATTCAADTDCPAAWKCNAVAMTTPTRDLPVSSSSDGNTSDGGAGIAAPRPPEETTKVCQSPLGYGGTAGRDVTTTDNKGDGTSTGTPPTSPTSPSPSGGNPQNESAASPNAGCSLAGNATGASSLALVAFGLVGLAVARRRRRA
jgi:hypothetical protein